MYAVSDEYKNTIMQQTVSAHWTGSIVTKNGIAYSLNDRNLNSQGSNITSQVCKDEKLELGTTYADSLDLELLLDYDQANNTYSLNGNTVSLYTFIGARVNLSFNVTLTTGTVETVKTKTFYVNNAERSADILTLTAYDEMLNFEKALGPTTSGTAYNFLVIACNSCGVTIGNTANELAMMPNGNLDIYIDPLSDDKISTWRDLVGYIALLLGGNARIGSDDKLYIKQFSDESVRTIPASWRYSSQIADYTTKYSGITATYQLDKCIDSVSNDTSDGLIYDVGVNPFLQVGVKDIRVSALSKILTALQKVDYTPSKFSCPCDPSLECMDVITLVDIQATGSKPATITKITLALNGKVDIVCSGENPNKIDPDTGLDKRFKSIAENNDQDAIHYYDYTNGEEIEIGDKQTKRVITFRYGATKTSRVEMYVQLLSLVDTVEVDTGDSWAEEICKVHVEYFLNGVKIEGYYPEDLFYDGPHILTLIYEFSTAATPVGIFEVFITVTGATVKFKIGQVRAFVSGTGLIGEAAWDGNDSIYEDFKPIDFTTWLGKFNDTVKVKEENPIPWHPTENVKPLDYTTWLGNFTATVSSIYDLHRFDTDETKLMQLDNVKNENGTWKLIDNTKSGTVTTPVCDVGRIIQITSRYKSNDTAYIVSFDGGKIWWTYTSDWSQPDYTLDVYGMFEGTMRSIPVEKWAEKVRGSVMVRAILHGEAELYDIQIYTDKLSDWSYQGSSAVERYNSYYVVAGKDQTVLQYEYQFPKSHKTEAIDDGRMVTIELNSDLFSEVDEINVEEINDQDTVYQYAIDAETYEPEYMRFETSIQETLGKLNYDYSVDSTETTIDNGKMSVAEINTDNYSEVTDINYTGLKGDK